MTDSDRAGGKRYRLVLRGDLGEPSGFLFEGMKMDRVAGTTVLTGSVIDQVNLHALIQRTCNHPISARKEPVMAGKKGHARARATRTSSTMSPSLCKP